MDKAKRGGSRRGGHKKSQTRYQLPKAENGARTKYLAESEPEVRESWETVETSTTRETVPTPRSIGEGRGEKAHQSYLRNWFSGGRKNKEKTFNGSWGGEANQNLLIPGKREEL